MTRHKATLPVRQLTILAICRFAEPVASTSVYPYIPEMIQSFNVPIDQVAKYSGWLSACFSLSQCLTAIAWGRASDRLGRKPMILLALSCIMIGSISFGFSSSLAMAFATRSLQGLSSGNVGIIRTSVAEMVPERELQPRAFSIMPLVWNIGSIFGPSIGGSLVRPVERYGGLFKKIPLLDKYPFAFPNLIISVLFIIGITSGFLFLRESHEDMKYHRDYGLILGKAMTRPCRGRRGRRMRREDHEEAEPFLGEDGSQLTSPVTPNWNNRSNSMTAPKRKSATGWKEVFSTQSNINLVAYTGLAMHSIAFDQILPVFLNYPPNSELDAPIKLPLKFSGGFGLKSPRIGLLFTIYGFFGMLVQFLVFPPLARKYGVLRCFKACALTFPIVYILIPFTSLLETNWARQAVCLIFMLIKCVAGIFAFPCSTILLTNSAASLKILGTLNGVATSVSAMGRAAGPALAGAAFTWGVDAGYVIVPFWVLTLVSILAALPIWWLIEMEGFSAKDHETDDEDEAENEIDHDDDHDSDEGFVEHDDNDVYTDNDEGNQGKRTLTDAKARRVSVNGGLAAASGTDAVDLLPSDTQQLSPTVTGELQLHPQSQSQSQSQSQTLKRSSSNAKEGETIAGGGGAEGIEGATLKKVNSPVGTGPGIVLSGARRYSSDLGTSRSGMGTGGSSFH